MAVYQSVEIASQRAMALVEAASPNVSLEHKRACVAEIEHLLVDYPTSDIALSLAKALFTKTNFPF